MISILHAAGYVLTKSAVPSLSPFIGVQNCSGFPGSIYVSRCSTCGFRRYVKWRQQAYSPHSVPSTQALDFPLPVARSENRGQKIYLQTHESSSIPEILFGTTTDLLRVIVDIEVRRGVQILYFVGSWSQLPVLEDGRGVTCRAHGHSWQRR